MINKSESVPTPTQRKVLEEFNMEGPYYQSLITVMIHLIQNSKGPTIQGLMNEIRSSGDFLINNIGKEKELVLKSALNIYLHYISKGLRYSKADNFKELQQQLIEISEELLAIIQQAPENIKRSCLQFIRNRIKILIYGNSPLIQLVLKAADRQGTILQLFIPECRPNNDGIDMLKQISQLGHDSQQIFDSAIGSVMENIDFVLTGADAVVENGGIINRIGSYTVAIAAKAHGRPFYVLAESFKFARLFPLNQKDIQSMTSTNNLYDYTPPDLITLLFTDLGTFTPSAVSEELIQIFNK